MRPRIGEAPPVETAITSGLRSTIEGMMKSESARPVGDVDERAGRLGRALAPARSAPSSSAAMKSEGAPAKSSRAGSRAAWLKVGGP